MNSDASPIRVLVYDHTDLVYLGLQHSLELYGDIEFLGRITPGDPTLRELQRLRPQIVILDIEKPYKTSVELIRTIKDAYPNMGILILTDDMDPEKLSTSIAAGASGFCDKGISVEMLHNALQVVVAGGVWLDPPARNALKRMRRAGHQRPETRLTAREKEVLTLIARGMSNVEISRQLNITPLTVKSHVQNILHKLDVSDRTQAAVKAVQEGLVEQGNL